MASDNILIINYCSLSIGGNSFIVTAFHLNYQVNELPECICSVVVGKDYINGDSFSAGSVDGIKAGTEAEVILTYSYNRTGGALPIFAGIVTAVKPSFIVGGGVANSLSYTLEITLSHPGSLLNAYAIGTRVFVPKNSSREAFFQTPSYTATGNNASLYTSAIESDNVSLYISEVINRYIQWETSHLKESPPNIPQINAESCILNKANLVGEDTTVLRTYVMEVVKQCIEAAQNGGNFLSVLLSLCNTFFLNVIPEYRSLLITHTLPTFKATEDITIKLPNLTNILGFNKINNMGVFPPDAVWVPRTYMPQYLKVIGGVKKPPFNPLYETSSQPHVDYFKYPDTATRTNGQIIDPPIFLKCILNQAIDSVKNHQNSERTTTTGGKDNDKKRDDSRTDPELYKSVGQNVAKLLYCSVAYAGNLVSLSVNPGWCLSNAAKDERRGLAFPLGKIISFPLTYGNGSSTHIGYCRGVSYYLQRDNNTFGAALNIDNVRSEEDDNTHSIAKSDGLLYVSA